eukprot:9425291-Pyramimonas_sp.AAC.1
MSPGPAGDAFADSPWRQGPPFQRSNTWKCSSCGCAKNKMASHVCKHCGSAWNAPKVVEPSPPAGVWAQNSAAGGLLPALSPGL